MSIDVRKFWKGLFYEYNSSRNTFSSWFGKGSNLKKVITEVLDGKVYTKVLNKDGKVVQERVKAFAEKNIGDKFVNTTTKVLKEERMGSPSIEKEVMDRVYDSGHRYLGCRDTSYRQYVDSDDWYKSRVAKRANNSDKVTITEFVGDGRRVFKYVFDKNNPSVGIDFNNKGLPLPDWAKSINQSPSDEVYKNLHDKSLKDMLAYHFKVKPYQKYIPDEAGLQSLNNRFADTPKLTDLDKYI